MKNVLRQGWATVKAYAEYFALGIAALAVSFACFILLASYVHRESATDTVFSRAGDIYTMRGEYPGDIPFLDDLNVTFYGIDPLQIPGVETFTRINYTPHSEVKTGERRYDATVIITDSSFFRTFDFPFAAGSATALKNARTAVLSRELSEKIFPGTDPLGRTVEWSGVECVVTGVMADLRSNTSIAADIILNLEGLEWRVWQGSAGFLMLAPGADPDKVEEELARRIEEVDDEVIFSLEPLEQLYDDASVDKELCLARSGNPLMRRILLIVALAVLAIGIFDYFNLLSVMSLHRDRELGIKRIIGASGGRLYRQLYWESSFAVLVAVAVALLLVEYAKPFISGQFGIEFRYVWSFDAPLLAAMVVGIAGLSPLLSYMRFGRVVPVASVGGNKGKRATIRTVLVTVQYAITMVLIIMSLWFVWQLEVMLRADPGYRTENILSLTSLERRQWRTAQFDMEAYSEEGFRRIRHASALLDAAPFIEAWDFGNTLTKDEADEFILQFRRSDSEKFLSFKTLLLSPAMQKMYDIPVLSGRGFKATDSIQSNKLLLTESAARALGIMAVDETALEISEPLWDYDHQSDSRYEVVGITRDIRPGNIAHYNKYPIIFMANASAQNYALYGGLGITVRYSPGKLAQTVELLHNISEEAGGVQAEIETEREQIEALYAADKRVASVYTVFAAVAVIVSTLGLFGLTLFDVRRKRREIALRRINGATYGQIAVLIVRRYGIMLLAAFVTACPVAWWALNRYAESFALKAPISWWIFAVSGLTAAAVALATVAWLVVRAASANPAEAIKTE